MHSTATLLCAVVPLLALWMLPCTATAENAGKTNVEPAQPRNGQQGQLVLAQVVFRHGARTTLQNTYWPDTQWTNCPEKFPSSLNLDLYDPYDSQITPNITDMTTPKLPGGCRMGRLTNNGYDMAVKLGQMLRRRYIDQYKLIPSSYRADSIFAHSTASQRTVNTLRGVLSGLYPDTAAAAAAVIRVSVRNESQEVMYGSGATCPLLANITAAVRQKQQQTEADDAHLQKLIPKIRSALNIPLDTSLAWSPLRDTILCMLADNKTLPVSSAAAKPYITLIDQIATRNMYQIRAPGPDNCQISKNACKKIVKLSVGMLLREIVDNMGHAAATTAAARPASVAAAAAAADPAAAESDQVDSLATLYAKSRGTSKSYQYTNLQQQQQQQQYNTVPHATSMAPTKQNYEQQQQQQQTRTAARFKADIRRLKHRKATISSGSIGGSSSSSGNMPNFSCSSMPRLVLYSGHDTTVAPLLTTLGQSHQPWPKFTSSLAIELWKVPSSSSSSAGSSGGSYRFEVRVLHDGAPLTLKSHGDASGHLAADPQDAVSSRGTQHSMGATDGSSSSSDLEIATYPGLIRGFGHEGSKDGISLAEFGQLVGWYVIDRTEHDRICRLGKSLEVS